MNCKYSVPPQDINRPNNLLQIFKSSIVFEPSNRLSLINIMTSLKDMNDS